METIDRRKFMALVAGTGAVASTAGMGALAGMRDAGSVALVPRRRFGKTGVSISKLCLGGGSFMGADTRSAQAVLDRALEQGVDCWEIVSFIGKTYADYFRKHPGARERIFLTAKVTSTNPALMQEQLDKVLAEHGTSVIDFLALWVVEDPAVLTEDVRRWVDKAKRDKRIRFFGFCTHKNMDRCLSKGADLDWIDGIQTVYNYRLRGNPAMQTALQKCHDKGIGIFAIKSMGLGVHADAAPSKRPLGMAKLGSALAAHGLSFEQAKLQAVWQNPAVTSICSLMPAVATLQANASAALHEQPLPPDLDTLLMAHADETARHYCRRCGTCDTATADRIPIFSVMEMLMYARGYGLRDFAAKLFAGLPAEVRAKIDQAEYSLAERRCPQKMPIAQLMRDAATALR